MRLLSINILFLAFPLINWAHGNVKFPFIENKGQWDNRISFNVTLPSGNLFLEKKGFTYHLMDRSYLKSLHTLNPEIMPDSVQSHGLFIEFQEANDDVAFIKHNESTHYYNYLIGHQTQHAKNVRGYQKVTYKELYTGIDLDVYLTPYDYLKYDFILAPGADPKLIKAKYSGANSINLKNGHLIIETSVTEIVEQAPIAYQFINGEKIDVPCNFHLKKGVLSYRFPKGYDQSLELVIDPLLIFSSFTGSSADNFGFTATYDDAENTYVGGIVFNTGTYPTTSGAFQTAFNGSVAGSTDIGISKFNPDGNNLIYSTYIGGAIGSDAPHSLVTNSNHDLFILGTTTSSDFPISAGCFQPVYGGGTAATPASSGMNYANGSDIIVSRLSSDGTTLIAGTFIGGSSNDGLNEAANLAFNYGDPFRGEIILDANEKPIVTTTTSSADFPTTSGAPQTTYGGGSSDGCAFRLNTTLNTLEWSTFIGGSNEDSGYGIQLNSVGDMYITGGTASADLNIAASAHHPAHAGGIDGYLVRYDAAGTTLFSSTFIGTPAYDQSYFVQVDMNDDIYVIGQTEGSYPVSPACYNNPNSGQFIQKYTANLTSSIWSTVIGTGSGQVDFSPSAFLVNDCGLIYISGWGGALAGLSTYQADFSTTIGLPITTGTGPNAAFQSTTDGNDFYLMVLNMDAASILYATFFGGGISSEHVDGGTSRFDKNGIVYQAVCAGCGGNSDFPTTPGAWSNTNNSTNCNLGVFKFGVGNINTSISIPQPYVCIPNSYQFFNNSIGGNQYYWDFGDGDSSNLFEPSHDYLDTGSFTVTLIVSDTTGCILSDTAQIEIEVFQIDTASIQTPNVLCPGDSVQLVAQGGLTYQWLPSTFLSDSTSAQPFAFPPITTDYMVIASDSCGIDTAYTTVQVYTTSWTISEDTTICGGVPTQLSATGGVTYSWEPSALLIGANTANPTIITFDTTEVTVEITSPDGCISRDTLFVNTITGAPVPILSADTNVCLGDTITITAGGVATSEFISPSVTDPFDSSQEVFPIANTIYVVSFTNQCGTVFDSIEISILTIEPITSPDTLICIGDTVNLWVSGGEIYSWEPSETLAFPDSSNTSAWPVVPTTYMVNVIGTNGCEKEVSASVGIYPDPETDAGNDQYITYGAETQLFAQVPAGSSIYWTSTDTLICPTCIDPVIFPTQTTAYILTIADANGCTSSDTVVIYLDGSLYVPNAFTPNGDGNNDFFAIQGLEIVKFQVRIFDRWGLQLFYSDNISDHWNGIYKGEPVQVDT
ncbi:MAG: gliding motility-associated C-terminal domain-containing protein, partial [Flavobacteriales bacterium]|nr:gliding motility-associated C-terminal domain-containing protein [Flavobacteriales bacterium]